MSFETELIFPAVVVFAAYLLRGIAGFGSALVAIPLLSLNYSLTLIVPLIVLLDYIGSLGQGFQARQNIVWSDILPLLPFTLLGAATALYLFELLAPQTLSRLLGGFVIVFAVYQLLPTPQIRGSRISALPYGFLGGLMGTLFGTGGPFYVIYLTMRGLGKEAFRASFATYFIVDATARLVGYGALGYLGAEMWSLFAILLPVAVVALFVGGKLHVGLSQTAFKRIISGLLLCSGAALLLK
ncbi:MAG: sulfite exporter TauE/SafE family protein [Gammaproteobacteria bacterium]|nr:sulfite exporter TauE/SafE family protein [Gammaproteobacteria bacterium]